MKAGYGLLLALVFGLAGAGLNYVYIQSKAGQVDLVHFIGVREDREIPQGSQIREEDLVRVPIPKVWVGNLDQFAVPASAWNSVIGQTVVRTKPGRSLILVDDLRTPPPELRLGPDEGLLGVPVDPRSVVPALINPGDRVSFLISQVAFQVPTPADTGDLGGSGGVQAPGGSGGVEVLGPFEVVSVGSRLGSLEVARAARLPQTQENVIGIRVNFDRQGNLPPEVIKLKRLLDLTANRPVTVVLHGKSQKR